MSIKKYSYLLPAKKGQDRTKTIFAFGLVLILILLFVPILLQSTVVTKLINPNGIYPLETIKKTEHEVFGFAPYWTLNKLDNVDFSVLTTLAYFGLPLRPDGSFDEENRGYVAFNSEKTTDLFKKAHNNGTRVVATITQMDNDEILELMDNLEAQKLAIRNITQAVATRGIDGINVDFEYMGDPGSEYRSKFTHFVRELTTEMKRILPEAHVTVSVYASAVKDPKIYDITALARDTDGIFMMAYDFATSGSKNVIPTAPLYGHSEGKYWYDISTAVDDFLAVMPKEKLILGLPWYGYDYPVDKPAVKASKDTGYYTSYWYRGRKYKRFVARPKAYAATYANAKRDVVATQEGWDEYGQVSWKAYQDSDGWRMYFLDDAKSLGIKYDFAKQKGLGGVGMWALGFDHGNTELWELLASKFGPKYDDRRLAARVIYEQ